MTEVTLHNLMQEREYATININIIFSENRCLAL